ncbi:hypothetical protein K439DRAFT_1619290 [Ramaria rubella]|nr:hypothetical protein K439DRAFT_1619290 [Ramaria rubella]
MNLTWLMMAVTGQCLVIISSFLELAPSMRTVGVVKKVLNNGGNVITGVAIIVEGVNHIAGRSHGARATDLEAGLVVPVINAQDFGEFDIDGLIVHLQEAHTDVE